MTVRVGKVRRQGGYRRRAPSDPLDGNDASEVDAAPDGRFWLTAIILALLLSHATIFLIGFLVGHLAL